MRKEQNCSKEMVETEQQNDSKRNDEEAETSEAHQIEEKKSEEKRNRNRRHLKIVSQEMFNEHSRLFRSAAGTSFSSNFIGIFPYQQPPTTNDDLCPSPNATNFTSSFIKLFDVEISSSIFSRISTTRIAILFRPQQLEFQTSLSSTT